MTSKTDRTTRLLETVVIWLVWYAVVDIMWRLYDGKGILG